MRSEYIAVTLKFLNTKESLLPGIGKWLFLFMRQQRFLFFQEFMKADINELSEYSFETSTKVNSSFSEESGNTKVVENSET